MGQIHHKQVRKEKKREEKICVSSTFTFCLFSLTVSADGSTPLLIACQRGHADVAKALLSRGASHSVPNQNGTSPLQAAAGQLLVRERERRKERDREDIEERGEDAN